MAAVHSHLTKGFIQSFEVKDIDPKSGNFIQAYTRYDVKDSDGDFGRRGMFTKTWAENMNRIRHLLNHDYSVPVGEPKKFWEDDEYAYMQSQVGTHSWGQDFVLMVESGLIKEASYGYKIVKARQLDDGSQELLEVKLYEVSSLTGWGANEFTPVISLSKSLSKDILIKSYSDRIAALEKFCRNTTATDTTIQMLFSEIKSLQQQVLQLIVDVTQADPSLEPHNKQKGETELVLKASIETFHLKNSNYQNTLWN